MPAHLMLTEWAQGVAVWRSHDMIWLHAATVKPVFVGVRVLGASSTQTHETARNEGGWASSSDVNGQQNRLSDPGQVADGLGLVP